MSKEEKKDTGKFSGWTNTNTNFGAIGDNSTGTIYTTPKKKFCLSCKTEVTNFPNNCQCMGSEYCGSCEGDGLMENCLCKKLVQKTKSSSNQLTSTPREDLEEVNNELISKQTLSNSKLNHFLNSKNSFLQARQTTIQELKACCNELEKFLTEKHAIIGEVGNTISNIGGSITNVITFGIPKALGETIKSSNNFSKIKFSGKSSQEFQIFLVNDETELIQLKEAYDSLVKESETNSELKNILNLKSTLKEPKLFNLDYRIFDILTDEGVWEGRPLNPEKMEIAIKTLNKNLKELRKELEQQFEELKDKFGSESINLNLISEVQEVETKFSQLQIQPNQEQNLQQQITIKNLTLENLINFAKDKLKSQSKFSEDKRKERNEKLESFFKNLSTNQDEFTKQLDKIKENLSKKLTWGETNELCQTQTELTKLKIELENLQQNQIQTLQVQLPYGAPSSSK